MFGGWSSSSKAGPPAKRRPGLLSPILPASPPRTTTTTVVREEIIIEGERKRDLERSASQTSEPERKRKKSSGFFGLGFFSSMFGFGKSREEEEEEEDRQKQNNVLELLTDDDDDEVRVVGGVERQPAARGGGGGVRRKEEENGDDDCIQIANRTHNPCNMTLRPTRHASWAAMAAGAAGRMSARRDADEHVVVVVEEGTDKEVVVVKQVKAVSNSPVPTAALRRSPRKAAAQTASANATPERRASASQSAEMVTPPTSLRRSPRKHQEHHVAETHKKSEERVRAIRSRSCEMQKDDEKEEDVQVVNEQSQPSMENGGSIVEIVNGEEKMEEEEEKGDEEVAVVKRRGANSPSSPPRVINSSVVEEQQEDDESIPDVVHDSPRVIKSSTVEEQQDEEEEEEDNEVEVLSVFRSPKQMNSSQLSEYARDQVLSESSIGGGSLAVGCSPASTSQHSLFTAHGSPAFSAGMNSPAYSGSLVIGRGTSPSPAPEDSASRQATPRGFYADAPPPSSGAAARADRWARRFPSSRRNLDSAMSQSLPLVGRSATTRECSERMSKMHHDRNKVFNEAALKKYAAMVAACGGGGGGGGQMVDYVPSREASVAPQRAHTEGAKTYAQLKRLKMHTTDKQAVWKSRVRSALSKIGYGSTAESERSTPTSDEVEVEMEVVGGGKRDTHTARAGSGYIWAKGQMGAGAAGARQEEEERAVAAGEAPLEDTFVSAVSDFPRRSATTSPAPSNMSVMSSVSTVSGLAASKMEEMIERLNGVGLRDTDLRHSRNRHHAEVSNLRTSEDVRKEEARIRALARSGRKKQRVGQHAKHLELVGVVIPRPEEQEADEFAELSDEALKLVERVWRGGDQAETFSEAFSIKLARKDLLTLRGLDWLNDEVINFYLNLVCERNSKTEGLPKAYTFNTFFYKTIMDRGFAGVKRWTRKVDIFSYDIILVPVHLQMHWCMAVIDFGEKKIDYYDSLGGKNHRCLDALRDYLEQESQDKKKQAFDSSGWQYNLRDDIPRQKNGSDCGVFSCKFADWAARRKDIEFSQEHMPYYRQRMVYELVTKQLMN